MIKGGETMAVTGFNVGSTLSLKDMSIAIDFLIDKDSFQPDLEYIKEKIKAKEKREIEKIR